MAKVGKGPLEKSSGPISMLKQDHVIGDRLLRAMFRWAFHISKNGNSLSAVSVGNLCQFSVTLTVQVRVFSDVHKAQVVF